MAETSIVGATVANPRSAVTVHPLAPWRWLGPRPQWPIESRAQRTRMLDSVRPPQSSTRHRDSSRGAAPFVPTLNITRPDLIGHLQPHAGVARPRTGSHGSLSRRLEQGILTV